MWVTEICLVNCTRRWLGGWVPGSVWTGTENLAPTGIRSPDLPARSESLYRPKVILVVILKALVVILTAVLRVLLVTVWWWW
jgi:hypothetical protein